MSRTGIWAALFAAASGCATELQVEDHSVFFPTVRASKRITDNAVIQVVADYAAGSDSQSVPQGRFVEIGGVGLSGDVDVDFDLTTVLIEARVRQDISPEWLVEGFFGVALYYVDVTATAGAVRGHDEQFVAGPLLGGRGGWRPVPRVQVYGEFYAMYPFPYGVVPVGDVEFGVEYKAAGPVSLLGGWRFRNLELVNSGSDFDFEWSGPFLGVAFDF